MNKTLEKIVIAAGITLTAVVATAGLFAAGYVYGSCQTKQQMQQQYSHEYEYDPMNRQRTSKPDDGTIIIDESAK